ncbi:MULTISPECIES: aldo/keto reductase [unclassified Pseudofrankia]|uniref:aldo/keto reductase n=1 Tax=unclassified Pseudofrankia TaxID=2994372 RepID=UPI0008DA9B27|nr:MULTISPECIES: aldo/keto reductase [unclassified Pseudofrankia]MDT3441369.1 aldo/keto reductase [Pseudofrankia sp. BMG5.37]OHV48052.1 hypothetical protein BCD48_16630 [Pseudofrankia sp. BMG5.36]
MHRPDRRVVLGLYRTRHRRDLLEAALAHGVRDLDTAFNYAGFASHARLAAAAADLLPEFHLSTKVGFFPAPAGGAGQEPGMAGRREHSLDPARLRAALETSADKLGRAPDVVFLHNPERTLRAAGPEHGHDLFLAAAEALADAARSGLCGAWGVSTWDAQPLIDALCAGGTAAPPRPGHLMHRAGVLVGPDALAAAETLARLLGVDVGGRWAMSPFNGDTRQSFWEDLRVTALLGDPPPAGVSTAQAAFRLAYELPPVTRVAVSTNDPAHLAELAGAARLDVDHARVQRYRTLLENRQRLVDAS